MARYLIVAHQTVTNPQLLKKVREVRAQEDGTAFVLLVPATPVRHLLFASTSSAYGANASMPFRETDAAATPLNIYAASKLAMEQLGHSHAHLWKQPVTAFRFFTVYGPWGRPDMAPWRFTEAVLRGEPIAVHNHGRMERDFTYVDDLVEAVVRLVGTPPKAGKRVAECDSVSPAAPFRVVNIGNAQPVQLLLRAAVADRRILPELPAGPGGGAARAADPSSRRLDPGDIWPRFAARS